MGKMNEKEMQRVAELVEIIADIDDEKGVLLTPTIKDIAFLETRLSELRELPFIRVSKSNPAKQQTTPAAKQYKELAQSYLNAVKILLTALYRDGGDGENELLEKLKEFSL